MTATILSIFTALATRLLTQRFLINFVVILAEWLAKKTDNDIDNKIVAALKESADKKGGVKAGNLYDKVSAR